MSLNTEHLRQCITTLERSLERLQASCEGSVDYEVFRNATIKGFELCLETAGKLLRKKLKEYESNPKVIDTLVFKDIFRHAHKHGLIDKAAVGRWFDYRANRNITAHDYGVAFAEQTLKVVSEFIDDVKVLEQAISTS